MRVTDTERCTTRNRIGIFLDTNLSIQRLIRPIYPTIQISALLTQHLGSLDIATELRCIGLAQLRFARDAPEDAGMRTRHFGHVASELNAHIPHVCASVIDVGKVAIAGMMAMAA